MSIFAKKNKSGDIPPEKPKPVPVKSAAYQDKKKIIIGLVLIVISFIGAAVIVFGMSQLQQSKNSRISSLQEKIDILNDQRDEMETEVSDLRTALDGSPRLENVIEAAKEVYGDDESQRREGILWIDRQQNSFVATLGMLNGVEEGAVLKVYDKDRPFGSVVVSQAFDVISFVDSPQKMITDYSKDYYRVVPEE